MSFNVDFNPTLTGNLSFKGGTLDNVFQKEDDYFMLGDLSGVEGADKVRLTTTEFEKIRIGEKVSAAILLAGVEVARGEITPRL